MKDVNWPLYVDVRHSCAERIFIDLFACDRFILLYFCYTKIDIINLFIEMMNKKSL